MYKIYKCSKCGAIDILNQPTVHGLRKESFTFVDCGGMMYPEDEPTQPELFDIAKEEDNEK